MMYEIEKIKCKTCGGSGKISSFRFVGVFKPVDDECHRCRGLGTVEESKKRESMGELLVKLENTRPLEG